jgi:hypothetical protein
VAIVFSLFLLLGVFSDQKNRKSKPSIEQKKVLSPFEMEKRDAIKGLQGQETTKEIRRPVIKSIKLLPQQPTVLDNIKAEVSASYEGDEKITFEYRWKVSGAAIDGIKGDTLPAGLFKKGDLISVRITPIADEIKGRTYESMYAVVHSAPPSLELKETTQKLNDTIESQLISKDPDGDKVTFSLEEPILEGMTIEKETGKIIWKPKKREEGTYKFGASATDIDGIKVMKIFEFKIETK